MGSDSMVRICGSQGQRRTRGTMMGLVYREVTPEEYDLVPREVPGTEAYTPDNSRILAAFNESGEVVSAWFVFPCVHIEPFWIRADYRHSKSIMRRMTEKMKSILRAQNIPAVYTIVMDTTPVLARFARWFGAQKVDGTLFIWVAPKE